MIKRDRLALICPNRVQHGLEQHYQLIFAGFQFNKFYFAFVWVCVHDNQTLLFFVSFHFDSLGLYKIVKLMRDKNRFNNKETTINFMDAKMASNISWFYGMKKKVENLLCTCGINSSHNHFCYEFKNLLFLNWIITGIIIHC